MKAVIFAAGKGVRLQPITLSTPKALVEVGGVPILNHVLKQLSRAGVDQVVINVHHLGDMIEDYLRHLEFPMHYVISREYDELLETGGGLKKAAPLLRTNEPFFIVNADILSNVNLPAFYKAHTDNNALVTLLVNERDSNRKLLFNDGILCGWRNTVTNEEIIARKCEVYTEKSFCGVHVVNPELLSMMTEEGKFSILKTYLRLAEQYEIRCYEQEGLNWVDIGTPEKLKIAEKLYLEGALQ